MNLRSIPIQRKLMLIILLTTAAVVLLMRGCFFIYEYVAFRKLLIRQASSLGELLATTSAPAIARHDPEAAREILSAVRIERQITVAALYDLHGRLFASHPAKLTREALPPTIEVPARDRPEPRLSRSGLIVFVPVTEDSRRLGTLYLRFETQALMREFIWGSIPIATGVLAVGLLCAYLLSRALQRQISQPILSLAKTARAISERHDFSVRAERQGEDELGLLTDAFNQLLTQIHAYKAALDEHAIVAITDPRGRITYANDKFCALSKYARDELLGQDHRLINSGHHPPEFIRDLWTTIARGLPWKGEIKNRAKDGTYYWVDTTIVPFLNSAGKPYQYVAIRADITQRKLIEEEIRRLNQDLEVRVAQRTSELQAAIKELEAFSYSVSHDLRAPLRHIDGFAGLLARSDGDKLTARGQRHLANIAESAKQMGRLIDELLSFSRMGRADMHITTVSLSATVDEAIRSLLPEMQNRRIEWHRTALPTVQADPPMLRQVFVNLLANAVKYTRPRSPAVIEIGCREEAGEIVIQVRDNGVGFEMQYQDKLFGVFQRLHRSEEFEGTGIGLANVRRIISRHGGRTWAESVAGAGATFYFSLPKSPHHHERS